MAALQNTSWTSEGSSWERPYSQARRIFFKKD